MKLKQNQSPPAPQPLGQRGLTNWRNASPWYPAWTTAANLKAFQAFLHERQTGLVQRSQPWVKARQHKIGASEIAVLTGASRFDTPASLIYKKLHPRNMSGNVACAWGRLFEPFARAYIEWYHATKVFGDTISLNLAKDHPLYGKVTCSPDGYFQDLDGSIVLLDFKCPFTRKIVVHKIPALYRDQVQTGLALSGDLVTKGLFVDCYFRMCSLSQLGINLSHNAGPHRGAIHKTKTPFPRAWGICILESKRKLSPNQASLLNLGTTTSPAVFTKIMLAIESGEIQVRYNKVRTIYDPRTKAEELFVLKQAKEQFRRVSWRLKVAYPVAFFAWKLLDITEIEEPKNPLYLKQLEPAITAFHSKLAQAKASQEGPQETVPNTLENDIDVLEAFLKGPL